MGFRKVPNSCRAVGNRRTAVRQSFRLCGTPSFASTDSFVDFVLMEFGCQLFMLSSSLNMGKIGQSRGFFNFRCFRI